MRTDAKFTNRTVRCPNVAPYGARVRRGAWITYNGESARYYGRVIGTVSAPALGDTPAVQNWLVVLQLSADGTHCYERWINPANVRTATTAPTGLLAFLAQSTETLPSTVECLRLAEYGTLCESYIGSAPERLAKYRAVD